jgi:hypothetical protein
MKHFTNVLIMTVFASLLLRLWIANAPVSARDVGLNA